MRCATLRIGRRWWESVFLDMRGLNIPPISAICQQIQNEHPQLAGLPLAVIEKSLHTLGFPANRSMDSPLGDRAQIALMQQKALLQMSGMKSHVPPGMPLNMLQRGMVPGPTESVPTSYNSSTNHRATPKAAMPTQSHVPDQMPMNLSQSSSRPVPSPTRTSTPNTLTVSATSQADTNGTKPNTYPDSLDSRPMTTNAAATPSEPTSQGLTIAAHALAQQALQRQCQLSHMCLIKCQ